MKLVLVLAIATAIMSGARGQNCEPTTSTPEVDVATEAGRFYIDHDRCFMAQRKDPCLETAWIYEESNSIDGLQRGREGLNGRDDTCDGVIEPDVIVMHSPR